MKVTLGKETFADIRRVAVLFKKVAMTGDDREITVEYDGAVFVEEES